MGDRAQIRTLGLHNPHTWGINFYIFTEITSLEPSRTDVAERAHHRAQRSGRRHSHTPCTEATLRALATWELRPCMHRHQNRMQHSPLLHLLAFGSFFRAPCSRLLISLRKSSLSEKPGVEVLQSAPQCFKKRFNFKRRMLLMELVLEAHLAPTIPKCEVQ